MNTTIVRDDRYGFQRLNPIPSADVLSEFYSREYYELLARGERFPEARRFMVGGDEAERERQWLRATLYLDVLELVSTQAPPGPVLDVGCGLGEMVAFLREHDVEAVGIEPSGSAVEIARGAGRPVEQGDLRDIAAGRAEVSPSRFGAVCLMNVLEHVVDPVEMIEQARSLLLPSGLLCVRVPNDFNALQLAAQQALGADPWWIRIPDHINYFQWDSLVALLEAHAFTIVTRQADFPMEAFLLMGQNYLGDPDVGARCHNRRVSFELALPSAVRRRLYGSLAAAGLGRTCMVTARLGDEGENR